MSFLYLDSDQTEALLGWPLLNSCLPNQSCTWAFSLNVGLQPSSSCPSPGHAGRIRKCHAACARVSLSLSPGLHEARWTARCCTKGRRREGDFLQNFRARKILSPWLVYLKHIEVKLFFNKLMLFGPPSSTWLILKNCHPDLWRPCHLGHCR